MNVHECSKPDHACHDRQWTLSQQPLLSSTSTVPRGPGLDICGHLVSPFHPYNPMGYQGNLRGILNVWLFQC